MSARQRNIKIDKMYAIVEIAGQQFKVEKGKKIFVHRLGNSEGELVDFDQVFLIDNEGKISIGEPVIEGAFLEGKVLTHEKGDKVIVFKKKRRKGYQKRNGHRQYFTHVEILSINEKGAPRKGKKAEVTVEKAVTATESSVKETAAKETVAKKPAVKKETAAKKAPAATKPAATKPAAKKAAPAKTAKAAPKAAAKAAPKAAAPKKSTKTSETKTKAAPKASPKKDKPAAKGK
jgi:large subunit ribosomal protein L21